MEFMVLDKNYDAIALIDAFTSAIWTVRYDEAGDFELYTPVRLDYIQAMQIGNYLWCKDSDRLMIIETVEIATDAEDGPQLSITGRSLESILERRIIASNDVYSGTIVEIVKKMITDEVIQCSLTSRRIPNFSYKAPTDSKVTSDSMEFTARGENLYDTICSLCKDAKLGWRILPKGSGGFEFELYIGTDRSYDQNENPYVVFSPSFENLINSNYIKSYKNYKNTVYAVGTYQKEVTITENDTTYTTYEDEEVTAWGFSEDSEPTGLARREIFANNGGVNDGEQGGTATEWNKINKQNGLLQLADYQTTTAFEGELEATRQYVYGEDFTIGDIVQVENEYGITGTVYISEIVISQDVNGILITPTFTSTEDETIE